MAISKPKDPKSGMDSGKYVRYTNEQVQVLERLYTDCPNPSSFRRIQLLKECKILSNIEPRQIKVWFQNRRCRDKQRKETSRLVHLNEKLSAMNKVLVDENDNLSKQAIKLVVDNKQLRQQLQQLKTRNLAFDSKDQSPAKTPEQLVAAASTETSSESVVTGGLQHQSPALHSVHDTGPIRLMAIAEATLTEFLTKATGTAVDWIQMPGMKPGPDTIGIVAISHGCNGIAARACGLVGLDPSKISELLKDRTSWMRDCRHMDILGAFPSSNGGLIELIYTQMYTPTTLAAPRDFCTLRYTTILEDRNVAVCECSLPMVNGEPTVSPTQNFIRAEVKSSGFLIRPYGSSGSIVHIVDHVDLQPGSVPEVLRPLYESSSVLAQKMTIGALRYLRSVAQEAETEPASGRGLQPSVIRTLCQRMSRGFNEAVNSLPDDGWSSMASDGMDDVTIAVNTSFKSKLAGQHLSLSDKICTIGESVLCAKTSMLLQKVPPAILIRFLREHRSEWADFEWPTELSSTLGSSVFGVTGFSRSATSYGSAPLLLSHLKEQDELLELLQLDSPAYLQEGTILPKDQFLLQLCSGLDESAVGASAQLAFAPVNVAVSEDMHLLPSGFRVVPLDGNVIDGYGASPTLDLASMLEGGSGGITPVTDVGTSTCPSRSILTIAFQFPCDIRSCESIAILARKYVRTVVASVLRVAMAIAPNISPSLGPRQVPGSPELLMLVRRILQSYRVYFGVELLKGHTGTIDASFKLLWHHPDAIFCCAWKSSPDVIFANQSGLDMMEISSSGLHNISWEKTIDQQGSKSLYAELAEVMQQGFSYISAGVRLSSTGRPAAYERAVAWKVDCDSMQCVAFMFVNWSF